MTLSRVDYWRLATLLPFVVPALLVPLSVVVPLLGVRLPHWAENGVMVAFMGAFMFGLVYVPIVIALLWLLRRRSWVFHASAAAVAPVLMVFGIAVATPVLMIEATIAESVARWAPYSLGLGYSYVAIAFVGFWLVQRAGGFEPAA
jgi:hypothetical protein